MLLCFTLISLLKFEAWKLKFEILTPSPWFAFFFSLKKKWAEFAWVKLSIIMYLPHADSFTFADFSPKQFAAEGKHFLNFPHEQNLH